jgi:hypothetical protein
MAPLLQYVALNKASISYVQMLDWARQIVKIIRDEGFRAPVIAEYLEINEENNVLTFKSTTINSSGQEVPVKYPVRWFAPELFARCPDFTSESAAYTFGMTIWQIVAGGSEPLDNFSHAQIYTHVLSGLRETIPEDAPNWAQDVIERCWEHNASARISIDGIANLLDQY